MLQMSQKIEEHIMKNWKHFIFGIPVLVNYVF
jgi:hypothetical protein